MMRASTSREMRHTKVHLSTLSSHLLDSREEKMTRGLIKATCDRNVTKSTIVICDSLNYIKGFRYELWCTSRSSGTPACVVSLFHLKQFSVIISLELTPLGVGEAT